MYEHAKITNTYAWIIAIANSKAKIANNPATGINPNTKVIIEIDINPKINVDKITINKWPLNVLAPNRNPNEMARAAYDNNSINTNTGTNGNGVPAGTNNPKNSHLWMNNPKIVTPNHNDTDNIITQYNWALNATEYGIIEIKFAIKIPMNNE